MESLTLLCVPSPESNAIWTVRMVKGYDVDAFTQSVGFFFIDFSFFVCIIYQQGRKVKQG